MEEKCNSCPVLEIYISCPYARKCLNDDNIPAAKRKKRRQDEDEENER